MRRRPTGHDHSLSMVRNHTRHEFDVRIAVVLVNAQSSLFLGWLVNGLRTTGGWLGVIRRVSIHGGVIHRRMSHISMGARRVREHGKQRDRDRLRKWPFHTS